LLKSTFNAEKLHTQVVLVYCQPFGAIHSWNVCRSPKWRKIYSNPPFWGFNVIQDHWCWHF